MTEMRTISSERDGEGRGGKKREGEGWGEKGGEEKGRKGIGREGGEGGQTQSRASVQPSRAGTLSCHVYIPTNELDFRCFFLPRRVKHF